ncbi:MAG: hypothetical protein IJ636_05395 [Bacteroidales bacterium]|nr:hypothetical protein [Bacteroidales bacterium]
MKRILFVLTLAASLAAACTGGRVASVARPGWFTNENYFEEKNGMYEEMPLYPSNIVMVGDDYIDRGIWNEFFGDTTIKNRGITYDATEHVLYRIPRIAAQKPGKIFVSAGWNDVLHGTQADAIVGNIAQIFKQIHKYSPKTKCYWLNIVGEKELPADQAATLEEVNDKVKEISGKEDFEVIDINAVLREGIEDGRYSWDGGKFLNGAGYEALAQAIERQVGKPHLNHPDDREYPLEVSDYYKHRVSLFRSLPATDFRIVMLGNSLNNNALWTELFPMGYIVNRGISGDVIDGVRQRLDEIVSDNPAKIYLITGTNDLVNDPKEPAIEVWNRYERLIKDIREMMPGTTLYVQSMLPLNPKSKFYEGFNDRAAEINKLLEAGKERYDYFYLDIASLLSDTNGDLDERYTTDGIHLSAAGYFVWAAELARGSRMMVQF